MAKSAPSPARPSQMRSDLTLPDQPSFSPETLKRIRQHTTSDYVITGSFLPAGDSIRVDLHIQNTLTGETTGALALTGTDAHLPEVAAAAGAGIRAKLGLQRLSGPAEAQARGSFPPTREAQQFYAEGLERLRAFDALQAQRLLSRAVLAAPELSAQPHESLRRMVAARL